MVPLLLYVPSLFRLSPFDMRAVAGFAVVQGFFASLSGVFLHKRHRHVCTWLVLTMGSVAMIGSFNRRGLYFRLE